MLWALRGGMKGPGAWGVLFSEAGADGGEGGKDLEQFLGNGRGATEN